MYVTESDVQIQNFEYIQASKGAYMQFVNLSWGLSKSKGL